MLNLVDKFTPETVEDSNDEGVVAIEYVLVAAAVALGVAFAFNNANLWQKLVDKIDTIL